MFHPFKSAWALQFGLLATFIPMSSPVLAGDFSYENPAASRYLYAPSAIPMEAGEGYIAQKELIFTSAAIGVSDNITVLAGMPIPWNLWALSEPELMMVVGGAKAGVEVAEGLWVGGGLEAFVIADTFFGLAFLNATVGNRDSNFTLGIGAPFFDGGLGLEGFGPVVFAGQARVSDGVALITENWMIFEPRYGASGIFSSGVRIIRETMTVDIALMAVSGGGDFSFIPIPWVDVAWHFGG